MDAILVIDDEPGIRNTVRDILEDEKYRVLTAEDGPSGLQVLIDETVDVVILDVWLPRMGGIDVLKAIKEQWPDIETIVISGHASIDMAVNAVKLGAFDFIEKPLSIDRLLTAVRNAKAIADLRRENIRLKQVTPPPNQLTGTSPAILAILKLIDQAATSHARVLITGENGTGKELAARSIHERSDRANSPFVAVNCAAIPENLIESELFGHEKGSFTDASARRKGKFEVAHRGTIFLDEIADMSPQAQAKVLRVIQDMRFERLGGEQAIDVDVRVIAATNKDLAAEIAAGRFREDLFFRLNVIPLHMPALRDRLEDIEPLAARFLDELSAKHHYFSGEACQTLRQYPWPGNVRELRNVVERLVIMVDQAEIGPTAVQQVLGQEPIPGLNPGQAVDTLLCQLMEMRLSDAKDRFERHYLVHNLRRAGYNISRAAEMIGMYASNLHAKIKKYQIEAGE
ncbi:MAG: Fis family transcriptional regulator [Spirochaetes bacterium GWD1_61_31]|nr:MAG: Fis family transcriptional regulator [Spirochaetes bacterium GWB1_60_80]OHD31298.1 MAG: Fis family transcriptional regulator [Spirochaetes bacterium GWC1_61_12]OHD39484.1 MAG: Fis family transcriptional regulator [Spirochaetes bacterium GWD1_61_31]OHD45536.1 MAG: Fis family transcriptional regulator [Spirochaetes bacterium GWE1_60_18]OHD58109.1 MAG: Fis family transcriptional regulator [Spirochaetes bacterium GWF1_60_12]HAP44681.1 Fis family transcriptional regulator [Spirochaetaceae b